MLMAYVSVHVSGACMQGVSARTRTNNDNTTTIWYNYIIQSEISC